MDQRRPEPHDGPDFHPDLPVPKDPPAIPDLLTKPVARPPTPAKSTGVSDMTKAWGTAMDFIVTVLAGLGLGYAGDRWWLGSGKRLSLLGLALGFGFALWRIIRRTLRDEAKEKASKQGTPPRGN